MSKFGSKRPSPSLVISILALFVALGGSAYAATKIGTKDIKANAITAGKIKKNAITTAKIKKEAVTGAKIKESSLGAVPNATSATNATTAANWSGYTSVGIVKANLGQTVQLASIGPFSIYGKCTDLGGGSYEAYTYATTSSPGSTFAAYLSHYYEADWNPGTEAEINYSDSSSGPYTNQNYTYYSQFWATSGDGSTRIAGNIFSGVHYFGAPCAFWGEITKAA